MYLFQTACYLYKVFEHSMRLSIHMETNLFGRRHYCQKSHYTKRNGATRESFEANKGIREDKEKM
jgi:hypothetical protein